MLIISDGIFVNKEIRLKIQQNLMAKKQYKFDDIKELYSHPQAIAQSRNFLNENMPNVIINNVSSTALAAKEIANKEFCACIANKSCAEEYGLTILKESIQSNSFNQTKFWVLSKKNEDEGNKMALIFSTIDEPGALYKVLGVFYKNNNNLMKIESRPSRTEIGEYIFLVEVEYNDEIKFTLEQINKICKLVKVLGRFKVEE